MNYRRLFWFSLGLWLVLVAAVGLLFVRGMTTPSSDGRAAIRLSPPERDKILIEMRTLLDSVQKIVQALPRGDTRSAAAAARASGMAMAAEESPELLLKLPLAFKQQGMTLHRGFDEFAAAADRGEPVARLWERLNSQLTRCVACHANWRLE